MKLFQIILFATLIFGINARAEVVKLDLLVEEAMNNNPEIKASKARWEAFSMRPSQEGSLPNPIIGGRIKNVSFSEITLGEDPRSDIQAFVAQEIPFPGKLSSKEKIAQKESESQRWLSDAISRKIIADLKETYFEWFFINKSIEITNRNKELLFKLRKYDNRSLLASIFQYKDRMQYLINKTHNTTYYDTATNVDHQSKYAFYGEMVNAYYPHDLDLNPEELTALVDGLNFAQKVERSLSLIEEAYGKYGEWLVVANSLGKDSVAVWRLAKRVSPQIRGVPCLFCTT